MIMLKSIAARLSWRSLVITVKQASETTSVALRVKKIRAHSDILSDALSGESIQSLQPSFAVLSSRAIFVFRCSVVVHLKNTRLEQAEVRRTFHFKILY